MRCNSQAYVIRSFRFLQLSIIEEKGKSVGKISRGYYVFQRIVETLVRVSKKFQDFHFLSAGEWKRRWVVKRK